MLIKHKLAVILKHKRLRRVNNSNLLIIVA